MVPPVTPSKPKDDVIHIIDRLNLRWKLQFSKNDLASPRKAPSDEAERPSQECVRRIRFIFYKNRPALEGVINNFEDWGKTLASEWRWKPKQEQGTLPSRLPEESFLLRNSLLEKVDITEQKRDELIAHLLRLLAEECYLLQNEPGPAFKSNGLLPDPAKRSDGSKVIPEIQGAQKTSSIDDLPRTKSLTTDSKRVLRSEVKSKLSKRKSTDTEVSFSAPTSPNLSDRSSLFGGSIFDDIDFDSLNLTSIHLLPTDADNDEVQASEPASPTKKRRSPPTIKDYMTGQKDQATSTKQTSGNSEEKSESLPTSNVVPGSEARPVPNPSTTFALPPPRPPPSRVLSKSDEDLNLSFASVASSRSVQPPSIFTPKVSDLTSFRSDLTEPSTQDTEVSIFNELAKSFDAPNDPVQELPQAVQELPQVGGNEKEVLEELVEKGPFSKSSNVYSKHLPLRYYYELSRLASAWKVPLQDLAKTPKDLVNKTDTEGYGSLWSWASCHEKREQKPLPDKSPVKAWSAAVDSFNVGNPGFAVQLTGNLSWSKLPGIFEVHLNPLRVEKSCRFYRKFGSHRFLSLLLPPLNKRDLPKQLQGGTFRKGISDWLSTAEHHFLGRTWRAFFVESEKRTKVKGAVTFKYKVHLFAVQGEGIPPLLISDLINWHIPLSHNSESSECKIFQRFSLGLSKALLTAVLRPSEFIHLKDQPGKPVMNDGCARISRSLATRIAADLDLNSIPSVFQARIAGAKGLWMVVDDMEFANSDARSDRGFYIEVSDSQLKIKPHPKYMTKAEADNEKLTFEVVTWSMPLKPANINPQLVSILQDRGVDRNRLEQLQLQDLNEIYEPLIASKDDRLSCRSWVQIHAGTGERSSNRNREIQMQGALPVSKAETAALLLESGFEPKECSFLVGEVKAILGTHLSRQVERLQIRVPLSTYALCIADPYQCLGPDEVHFGFSKNWESDTATESLFADNLIDGMDVLVGRLPALLPSDIQKRKAVWKKKLRHFKDVIVFPTTGDQPLADLLSGGDYDGDTPWICWDPVLVSSFQNIERDPAQPFEYFGIAKNDRKMVQSKGELDGFLSRSFDFNLHPTFLESVSVEHEKVRYQEKDGVSYAGAKDLATLAGLLVDAPKQGYHFSEDAWHKFRSKVSPKSRFYPAYKSVEGGSAQPLRLNYLDFLKFWIAIPQKEKLLQDFQKHWIGAGADTSKRDLDLSQLWLSWWTQGEVERKNGNRELLSALEQLRSDVKTVHDNFRRRIPKDGGETKFAENTRALQNEFQAIRPLRVDHELINRIDRESRENIPPTLSIWNWLRASCTYEHHHFGKFPWFAAGNILCAMKVFKGEEYGEPVRVIKEDIYVATKIDSRIVKRIQARDSGEEEWDDDEADDIMTGLIESGVWE